MALLRVPPSQLEELPEESLPIVASNHESHLIVTHSDSSDVLVTKLDDAETSLTHLKGLVSAAREKEQHDRVEKNAMAYGRKNGVFDEFWGRGVMERQARLLEKQLKGQAEQQRVLTSTLGMVARAFQDGVVAKKEEGEEEIMRMKESVGRGKDSAGRSMQ